MPCRFRGLVSALSAVNESVGLVTAAAIAVRGQQPTDPSRTDAWASAARVQNPHPAKAEGCGACVQTPARDGVKDLSGTSWQLVKFQGGDDTTLTPDDKAKYTITFEPDGHVSARIDEGSRAVIPPIIPLDNLYTKVHTNAVGFSAWELFRSAGGLFPGAPKGLERGETFLLPRVFWGKLAAQAAWPVP